MRVVQFGNVYVKYATEEEGEKCINGLRGRYYGGRLILPEYSPVTSFGEARCRQFDEGHCGRGGVRHTRTLILPVSGLWSVY
jgi:splicing factor U2AF 35 kDa subunit